MPSNGLTSSTILKHYPPIQSLVAASVLAFVLHAYSHYTHARFYIRATGPGLARHSLSLILFLKWQLLAFIQHHHESRAALDRHQFILSQAYPMYRRL